MKIRLSIVAKLIVRCNRSYRAPKIGAASSSLNTAMYVEESSIIVAYFSLASSHPDE